ncbi:MAG: hypothetical protein A2V90_00175 [Gammaproteobacteria bacterium RBG_16_57_12]|nr:MAG: hypothetical protein A2V90_00175 [Gammaproteobacteria bacterium RBG_16_57_12]
MLGYIVVIMMAALLVIVLWQQFTISRTSRRLEGRLAPELGDFLSPEIARRERVVLYFFDPGCTVCRSLRDAVASLAGRYPNMILVDVTRQPQLARRFAVTVVPVFVLIKKGMVCKVLVGQQAPGRLESLFVI